MVFCYSAFVSPAVPKLLVRGVKLLVEFNLITPVPYNEKVETDLCTEFIWLNLEKEIFVTISYQYIIHKQVEYNEQKKMINIVYDMPVSQYDVCNAIKQATFSTSPHVSLSIYIEEDFLMISLYLSQLFRTQTWALFDLRTLNEIDSLLLGLSNNEQIAVVKDDAGYVIKSNTDNKLLFVPSIQTTKTNKQSIFNNKDEFGNLCIMSTSIWVRFDKKSYSDRFMRNNVHKISSYTDMTLKYQCDCLYKFSLFPNKTPAADQQPCVRFTTSQQAPIDLTKDQEIPIQLTKYQKGSLKDLQKFPPGRLAGDGASNKLNPY